MYKEHPVFKDPANGEVKIWRYFDFTKFVSLIERQSLFFCRADKFKDPFEGSWTKLDIAERERIKIAELKAKNPQISEEEIGKALRQDSNFFRNTRRSTLINSWHFNESESAAMWKLFLKSNEGIAIQSTTHRFKKCFRHFNDPVYIGQVNYIDYDRHQFYYPFNNTFVAFLHKRNAFEHEREYRAILSLDPNIEWEEQDLMFGRYIKVDIEEMIEKVYVSPGTPGWYTDLIINMLKRYNLDKDVVPSLLNRKPIF